MFFSQLSWPRQAGSSVRTRHTQCVLGKLDEAVLVINDYCPGSKYTGQAGVAHRKQMLTRSPRADWVACRLCTVRGLRLRSISVLHGPSKALCSHPFCRSLAAGLGRSRGKDRSTRACCRAGKPLADSSQFEPSSWRDSFASDSGTASAVAPAVYDTWGTDSDEQDTIFTDRFKQQSQHPAKHASNGYGAATLHQQQPQEWQHPQQGPQGYIPSHQRASWAQQQQQVQPQQQQQQPAPATADVQFSIKQRVEYGQILRVVGSAPALGSWNPSKGPDMTWHRHDRWTVAALLPIGHYEFKYLLVHRSGHLDWEPGSNRVFDVTCTPSHVQVQVQGHWGATDDTDVLVLQQQHDQQQQQQQLHPAAELLQRPGYEQQQRQQQSLVKLGANTGSAAQGHNSHSAAAAGVPVANITIAGNGSHPIAHAVAAGEEQQQQALSPALSQAAATAAAATLAPVMLTGLSRSQQQLVDELAEQRQQLTTNIAEIATGVKEINIDLDLLHDDLAHITAERVLQEQQTQRRSRPQQQQQQQATAGSAASHGRCSAHDSGWSDQVSQAVAKAHSVYKEASPYRIKRMSKGGESQPHLSREDQASMVLLDLLGGKAGSVSSSQLRGLAGTSSSSNGTTQPGHDAVLDAADSELMTQLELLSGRSSNDSGSSSTGNELSARDVANGNGSKASWNHNSNNGNGSSSRHTSVDAHAAPQGVPALVSAETGNHRTAHITSQTAPGSLSTADPVANLQCAVLSWRQELLSFRHDALLLQEELAAVEDSISSVQQQMAANRAAWAAPGDGKQQGSNGKLPMPAASPSAETGLTAASAVDGALYTELQYALVDPGMYDQPSSADSTYRQTAEPMQAAAEPSQAAAEPMQAAAVVSNHRDSNAAAVPGVLNQVSANNNSRSSAPIDSDGSCGSVQGLAMTPAPAANSSHSFAASTTPMPVADGSSSSSSQAPVADNVSEYQRLLRHRFHELADQIAADLATSAESLTEEAQQQREQQQKQKQRKQQQPKDKQQGGAAKFAAAHNAASAAYANGRTPAGDTFGGGL